MRAIFISYRREDAEGQAGRLFDDLTRVFGEDRVFMDVAAIAPGRDFRRAIDEHVASCCVLLAVIGKSWINAQDESGKRRLDDAGDFVRLETASALKRDIPVIPVLVHGAQMPRADQLPPDLKDLAYRNAVELTHARWDSDVQVLILALSPLVESSQKDAPASIESPARVPVRTAGTPDARPSADPETAVTGRAPSAPSRRWSMGMVIVGATVVIAVALGGVAWYQRPAQSAERIVPVVLPDAAREQAPVQPEVANQADAKNEAERLAAQKRADQQKQADAKPPGGGGSTSAPPSSRRFSLVGSWKGAPDCDVAFYRDNGKEIEGSCDTAGVLHKITGAYDDTGNNITITIARTDRTTECQTSVRGYIKIIDPKKIEMSQAGWDGCGVKGGVATTTLSMP